MNGKFVPDSENVMEREGYVEIWHLGPLNLDLYPPYEGSLAELNIPKASAL